MMKKLIKVGVVMSLLLTSTSAFAQEKAEYPSYGFWSNWSLGGGLAVTWEMGQHSWDNNAPNTRDLWRRSINVGLDVFGQKKLNHVWDFRLRLSHPTLWQGRPDNDNVFMARYTSLTAEFLFSLNNACSGYDPECHHNWYLFAGAGGALVNGLIDKDNFAQTRYNGAMGKVLPVINAGLGYSLQFSDDWSFYVEGEFNGNDYPAFWHDFMDWKYMHLTLHTGVMYNFGLTEEDKQVKEQKDMLTEDNFKALNSQVNNLERQLASTRNNEKKLENRIAELEDQLAQALQQGGRGNNAAADSLQAVIDQIKNDQLKYYGMPFSVLYGVDEWQVSDEEEAKVKAVARVLKDNPDMKIMVVGFADYTGSDNYNMKLSEKRAKEVKRLLVKRYGIAEDRITVDFKGKQKEYAFGDIQFALNRRVSFYRVIE